MISTVLYLHGFASSPNGRKALAIGDSLRRYDIHLEAPDLNVPSFESLDFDSMVDSAVDSYKRSQARVIVGSSLGALVALETARRVAPAAIVLIAPALGIADLWTNRISTADPIWVFNHALEAETPIHRAFFERMERVDVDAYTPRSAVTVFMGSNDESVPFRRVRRIWDSWEKSGELPAGSRFVEIPEGDHGLVEHAAEIAHTIHQLVMAPSPLSNTT